MTRALFAVLPVLVLLLALSATTASTPVTAQHPCSGPPFIFGDWTDDDRVDSEDVTQNLRYVIDSDPLFAHSACGPIDADCDGTVTVLDALKLLAFTAEIPLADPAAGCPEIGSDTGG